MFFRSRKLTIFGSLGPVKPRIREYVKFGNLDSAKILGHEHAKAQNLELAMARTSEDGRFGNLSRTKFGVTHEDMYEPMKKRRPSRESVEDPVRESRVKTFTNWWRSKVKVVIPKSPGLECELVADLQIC
jgi:hypothetical protein